MRFATPLSLLSLFLQFLSPAHAQDNITSYIQDWVSTLQGAGLTGLADTLTKINETASGQTLFSELASDRNFTLFAPNNLAVQNIPSSISGNTSLLADYIAYHIVHGNLENTSYTSTPSGSSPESVTSESPPTQTSLPVAESGFSTATLFARLFGRDQNSSGSDFPQIISGVDPNVTLGRTLLRSSDLVTLGGRAQVLAWTRTTENCSVTILNQPQNVTIVNATTWRNLFINAITGVLVPPGNLTSTFAASNVSAAQGFFNSVQVPSLNGTNQTAIDALQEARGVTLFIPNNDAFTSDVNQTLQNLQNNQTALTTVLQNHYINGTTVYSSQIPNELNLTTAAGEPIEFVSNDTGLFVAGANGTSAKVVQSDILLNNGVAYVIDGFLADTNSDPSAASSAFASATSEAALSTTETGPIGIFTSPTTTTSETSLTSTVTVFQSAFVRP